MARREAVGCMEVEKEGRACVRRWILLVKFFFFDNALINIKCLLFVVYVLHFLAH